MFFDLDLIGRTHWNDPFSTSELATALTAISLKEHVDFVCVGTDRSTGDSLGPLVGTALRKKQTEGFLPAHVRVHGTVHEPVHALNLAETIESLRKRKGSVVAIDACLGRAKSIGNISIKKGPLRPGTGVHKELPKVGDFHIIGVVNVAGFMEHVVLQNTRLSLVMQMAEVIINAIVLCFAPQLIGDSFGKATGTNQVLLQQIAASSPWDYWDNSR